MTIYYAHLTTICFWFKLLLNNLDATKTEGLLVT